MSPLRPIPFVDAPTGLRTYRLALVFALTASAALLLGKIDGATFALVITAIAGLVGANEAAGSLRDAARRRTTPLVENVERATVHVEQSPDPEPAP